MSAWSNSFKNKGFLGTPTSEAGAVVTAPTPTEGSLAPSSGVVANSFLSKAITSSTARDFSGFRDALSVGTIIKGKLSFEGAVRIDGVLGGQVRCSDAVLIGERAQVDADVIAESLVILGRVKGSLKARGKIEVLAGAVCEGELFCEKLSVEPGAVVNSKCLVG